MNKELIKELSNLQLLHSTYRNKINMCPLSITKEENKAFIIFDYIRELQAKLRNKKKALNEIRNKLLCYGETFDSDIHKQFQKECLEIIDKVLGEEK